MPSNNAHKMLAYILQMDLKSLSQYTGVPYPRIPYKHREKLATLFQAAMILARTHDHHDQLRRKLGLDTLPES